MFFLQRKNIKFLKNLNTKSGIPTFVTELLQQQKKEQILNLHHENIIEKLSSPEISETSLLIFSAVVDAFVESTSINEEITECVFSFAWRLLELKFVVEHQEDFFLILLAPRFLFCARILRQRITLGITFLVKLSAFNELPINLVEESIRRIVCDTAGAEIDDSFFLNLWIRLLGPHTSLGSLLLVHCLFKVINIKKTLESSQVPLIVSFLTNFIDPERYEQRKFLKIYFCILQAIPLNACKMFLFSESFAKLLPQIIDCDCSEVLESFFDAVLQFSPKSIKRFFERTDLHFYLIICLEEAETKAQERWTALMLLAYLKAITEERVSVGIEQFLQIDLKETLERTIEFAKWKENLQLLHSLRLSLEERENAAVKLWKQRLVSKT